SLLKEVDGGRIRLANALKSVGPLAGLAGSVLGLMMYSAEISNQGELTEALGFLLSTTLAGTYIAIAAWLVTFLMESEKERIQLDCISAWERVQHARSRRKATGGTRTRDQKPSFLRSLQTEEKASSIRPSEPPRSASPKRAKEKLYPIRLRKTPIRENEKREEADHATQRCSIDSGDGKRLRIF
ncbi:MAG: MotA/TolQ/ExbB proton channel family protein, partial [Candidatus Omnitrophica bacterium]|nr:MotA/TolQ/ExbB proton channel family protein [Candidatus Omnitrophota bacterium]